MGCGGPGILGVRKTAVGIGAVSRPEVSLDLFSLEMFENIAYTMEKHAAPVIADGVEEWLDRFKYVFHLPDAAGADKAVGAECADGCGC